jgi:alpha-ketoglutaric semialdehyde dehydrogenase
VAGIITPWNFPIAIPCWKMMPALVTGNTVVFKPRATRPHCATLLVELMAEAGFPAGTVNLVTGSGAEVGDAIVENPGRARHLVHGIVEHRPEDRGARGRRLKRLSLELGGKNASSCWPTRTSTSRWTGSCGRRSGRRASAARRAPG